MAEIKTLTKRAAASPKSTQMQSMVEKLVSFYCIYQTLEYTLSHHVSNGSAGNHATRANII